MGRRVRCPRCQGTKSWDLKSGKQRCGVCRYDWRPQRMPLRLTRREWGRLMRWFVLGLSAAHVAQEAQLGREQVLRALLLVRQAMAGDVPPTFSGVVEVDETYLGGSWRNKRLGERVPGTKRGRGTSKQAVFGILCRGGEVWAEVVPNVEAKTLLPLLHQRVQLGSVVCSDTFTSYTGVAAGGYVHRLVDHSQTFSDRRGSHVNGLEGFWGYLKRRLAAKGGIRRERLPLYLAEYVWRYNHRHLTVPEQVKTLLKLMQSYSSG